MFRSFFAVFVFDLLLAMYATSPRGNRRFYAVVKSLLMPLLFLSCCYLAEEPPMLPMWALAFGFMGDVLLLNGPSKKRFALGMLAFAAGHISYTVCCLKYVKGAQPIDVTISCVFLLLYLLFFFAGRPRLTALKGPLQGAACVYAFMLALMGFSATLCYLTTRNHWAGLTLLGAVLFILSDSLLSMQKFRKQTKWGNTAVIGTYGAAQACMSIGLTLLLCPPLI